MAFHLAQLSGDALAATVGEVAEDLLTATEGHALADLVEADAITPIVARALADVPGSAAVGAIVELVGDLLREGPAEPFPIGDVVDRAQVEELLDQVLALTPVLERALERLTASPLVAATASRFMARVVGEVLATNQAVADKVPGLGGLVSWGTSTASKVMGAADKQLEGMLGEAVGKGGTFAVRRLNRIVLETLRDPTTREALLQVWDLVAHERVEGLGRYATEDELAGVVDAAHALGVSAAASEQANLLGEAVVEAFFDRFGGYSPTELLAELDLDRADLVADLVRIAPGVVDALRESGELERIIRARLEPFYDSPEVLALLA